MFECVIPGSENPADQNWMTATYISGKIENGTKLGINDPSSLLEKIKPFIEWLLITKEPHFYSRLGMGEGAFFIDIKIKNGEEYIKAGLLASIPKGAHL